MTVREVLHAHIPTLTPESTVRDAVDKMDLYQFPALVVVDRDMRPVAVVTEGDVCRYVTHADGLSRLAQEPVGRCATHDPVLGSPTEEIGDAFHRMLSSGLTILPVVEDDRLLGIVLRVDLMQAMILDSV